VTPLLVALGAAAGAPLRLLAGHWLDRDFPFGTLLVNVLGSFLLGWFSAMSLGDHAYALLAACAGGFLLGQA
jgi:CrcB protein